MATEPATTKLSLSELLGKIDSKSINPSDWDGIVAELTRLLSLETDKAARAEACAESELPLNAGPVPPVSVYKMILDLHEDKVDFFLHGDLGGASVPAEMLKEIVERRDSHEESAMCYTMDHFFLLCDYLGGAGPDVYYIENEDSRQHLKLSLLGIVCKRWDIRGTKNINVTKKTEYMCNILLQLVRKYPKVLWSQVACQEGDGYIETTAWRCVEKVFEGLLTAKQVDVEDKKRFLREYYFPLKQSYVEHFVPPVPPKDAIAEFMEQHGVVDPADADERGLGKKRQRTEEPEKAN